VIIEVVLGRPVLVFTWRKDVPVSKGENVAGKIMFGLHPLGYENLILDTNAHQAFSKDQ
jgi:hypothetical protein